MCYCPEQDPTELANICRQQLSKEVLQEAFVPTYTQMKKYQGEWHQEERVAFPDHIFLETEDADALHLDIEKCCRNGKLSYQMIQQLVGLQPEQEKFLRKVLGTEKHIKLSKGYIKDGCTYVTQGPLQGKEKLICKIDRHKRLAKLEIPIGDGCQEMHVGLEIVSKN